MNLFVNDIRNCLLQAILQLQIRIIGRMCSHSTLLALPQAVSILTVKLKLWTKLRKYLLPAREGKHYQHLNTAKVKTTQGKV